MDDVRARLREHLRRRGDTQASWADTHGLARSYVSDFLRGARGPTRPLLEAMGLEAVTLYAPKSPGGAPKSPGGAP